jgi:hypothetical protein
MTRRLMLPVLVLACTLPALGAPAHATPVVGLSDQLTDGWSDMRLRALGLHAARLVVPWDAATSEPARVQAWLTATAAAGMVPHVAFEHLRGSRCPASPCVTPSRAQFRAAFRAFRARFPQVTTFTTWNEANHESQPVAGDPEAVAGFYEDLVAACPTCTVVAGDVLDSGSYARWLRRFLAASGTPPRLWGLHNYGDVTYGRTSGTDTVLGIVPGTLWIEETGGIVTLRNSAGSVTLSTDESRAAQAIDRAFAIVRARPRITRMYLYQWRAPSPFERFDAGLVRPDGSARPSLDAVMRNLPTATAASPAPAPRWTASWRKDGRLALGVRCRASDGRCRGSVRIVLRTRRGQRAWRAVRLARRTYRTTAAKPAQVLRIAVPRAVRVRARRARLRRLVLSVTPALPVAAATSATVWLARPR